MWKLDWVALRRRWWPGRRRANVDNARRIASSSSPSQRGPRKPGAFEEALAALAASPNGGAGRVRVVSLADFRETVGDKWPRLADKVAMIAEAVIRRHMGAGNLHQQTAPDTWMLAFPRADAETARQVAARIAQDLSRHLLGDSCVGGERPLALAAHVVAGQVLDDDNCLDMRMVRRAIDDSRSMVELHAADAMGWRPVQRGSEGPVRDRTDWQPLKPVNQAPEKDPWHAVAPMPPDGVLRLLWRPTWVAEGEAISAYCARVLRIDHESQEPLEGALAYPANHSATTRRIDRFVAATALRALANAHAAGRETSIIVPLTWESLTDDQVQMIALFADLPAELRRRSVRVEVFRIPDHAEPDEIRRLAAFVREICGDVLLRLRLASPLIERIGELGADHVGLDLSELRASERMNDDLLLSTLENLQDDAVQAGLGCYLWSARRRRVVGGVVQNGFEMVNGPGLMKDVGHPAVAMPAPRQRFGAH